MTLNSIWKKFYKFLSDLKVNLIYNLKLKNTGFAFPSIPMLEQELVNFFDHRIESNMALLEYGSGGSTFFLADRALSICTVENQKYFARLLEKELNDRKIENVDIYVPQNGITGQGGIPMFRKNSFFARKLGIKYANIPFEDTNFDKKFNFVFIDGRFRLACAMTVILKNIIPEYTMIIDDYFVNELPYEKIESYLSKPKKVGRAAVFEITRSSLNKIPSNAEISQIAGDWN